MLAAIFIQGGIAALEVPAGPRPGGEARPRRRHARAREGHRRRGPDDRQGGRRPRPSTFRATTTDWLDDETLVKIDGGVKVVAGTMLALGKFPAAGLDGAGRVPDPDDAGRAPLLGGDGPARPSRRSRSTSSRTWACSAVCSSRRRTPRASRRSPGAGARPPSSPRPPSRPRPASVSETVDDVTGKVSEAVHDLSGKVSGAAEDVSGRLTGAAHDASGTVAGLAAGAAGLLPAAAASSRAASKAGWRARGQGGADVSGRPVEEGIARGQRRRRRTLSEGVGQAPGDASRVGDLAQLGGRAGRDLSAAAAEVAADVPRSAAPRCRRPREKRAARAAQAGRQAQPPAAEACGEAGRQARQAGRAQARRAGEEGSRPSWTRSRAGRQARPRRRRAGLRGGRRGRAPGRGRREGHPQARGGPARADSGVGSLAHRYPGPAHRCDLCAGPSSVCASGRAPRPAPRPRPSTTTASQVGVGQQGDQPGARDRPDARPGQPGDPRQRDGQDPGQRGGRPPVARSRRGAPSSTTSGPNQTKWCDHANGAAAAASSPHSVSPEQLLAPAGARAPRPRARPRRARRSPRARPSPGAPARASRPVERVVRRRRDGRDPVGGGERARAASRWPSPPASTRNPSADGGRERRHRRGRGPSTGR